VTVLVTSPIFVPLLTAVAAAFAYRRPALQQTISFAGILALLGCALALVAAAMEGRPMSVSFGGWEASFGIEFKVDRLGAIMVLLTAIMGLAALLFQVGDPETNPRSTPRGPFVLPLLHGMLIGVCGAFVTADLFNMYVWFEVMLIGVLGLFAAGGRIDQLEATFKYFVLNVAGTLLLVVAVGSVYAVTGQLNYTALSEAAALLSPGMALVLLGSLAVAFLVKAGAFPLFAWLPAAYHTLPGPVLALVAGLLTKVGVYALLRVFGDVFAPAPDAALDVARSALGWIAAATMLTGVLGAAYHWDMRRILGFHIISQIGYMLLGIALGSDAGNGGTLFYTAHHIIVKANLFFIAAMVWRLTGSYDLRRIGGLANARPALALVFAIPALSLVGIPPLSGFWAKLIVLREALSLGHVAWTVVALVVSFLTLYSMMKIWMEAFWKPHPQPSRPLEARGLAPAWCVTAGLALVTVMIGLFPEALAAYCMAAAAEIGGVP
jgi:multicomponent Na+:H+ antiporter subunit D